MDGVGIMDETLGLLGQAVTVVKDEEFLSPFLDVAQLCLAV